MRRDLVRLDMPELGLKPGQPRQLEMKESSFDPWNNYVLERFGADGRVRLLLEGGAAQARKWVDLSKREYRWCRWPCGHIGALWADFRIREREEEVSPILHFTCV